MTTAQPDVIDVKPEALDLARQAKELSIADTGTYLLGTDLLKAVKDFQRQITDDHADIKKKAYDSWQATIAKEKKHLAPLLEAEQILKRGLGNYQTEQERIRKADEARLAEEARQRELERRLEEAAALEREGVDTDNPELILEAEDLVNQPIQAQAIVLPSSTPAVRGISSRETWSARVTNLSALIKFVAAHPEHTNLLSPNTTALNQLARALKSNMRIEGVQVYSDNNVAVRTR